MLYRSKHVFINGESLIAGHDEMAILRVLADSRSLAVPDANGISEDLLETLYAWYLDGWLFLRQS